MTKYIQRVDGLPKQYMWNNYSYTYSRTYSRWYIIYYTLNNGTKESGSIVYVLK